MTEAQAKLARQLLLEALDWVGMDDLTEAEEEMATEVQCRIERLLMDLGDLTRPRNEERRWVLD